MNQPIILLLTVIQIWNKFLKFQLNRVVYLCLCNICTKFQVDTSFLSWVLFNNLTSIRSIWQRPRNHSTNIFIRIFLLHRIHWSMTRKVLCEVSDDNKGDDCVPSLLVWKLDEMGHLPFLGETKSPKQGPASQHVFSCGDVDHISHDKLVME